MKPLKHLSKYASLCRLSAWQTLDCGLLYTIGEYTIPFVRLIILLLIWRSLIVDGADAGGMSLGQVLTYTLMSSVLAEQLNVVTPATTSFWEGSITSLYTRPMGILPQLMAETVGRWLPSLILYSAPMLFLAGPLGVTVLPASPEYGCLFVISFFLSVSLGFAFDFLFASLAIHMKNASWMVYTIRQAIGTLLSGALIPLALLPWGIGGILRLLPFGSVAGAPLSIFIGDKNAVSLLMLQLFWNIALWPMALAAFRKSQERMVSYGG